MAESHLAEVFPRVKLHINRETLDTLTGLQKSNIETQERGSFLEVSGTFKNIEHLFQWSHEHRKKGEYGAHGEMSSELGHVSASMASASSAGVKAVEVDSVIMSYIEEKCSAELKKIRQCGVNMQVNNTHVTFHPLDPEHGTVPAKLARERFITFYQKIATGLRSRSYRLDEPHCQLVREKFPDLQISTGKRKRDEITLTGRFISLERFEQFLKGPPQRSSSSQMYSPVDTSAAASSPALENKNKEETCCICLEQMVKSQMKTLEKCKHTFCRDCLKRAFEIKPVCPTCGVIYGALKGTQPKGGKMNVTYNDFHLPGYENYKTIVIHYIIPDGIQGDEHPNPGQPYQGAVRLAYLPDCTEGKKVLHLLKQAFDQRLIFTVGRSSTTGRSNVVTWNDIHHKTSYTGGPTAYGYPDPDYLKRVQEELKVKGIY